MKSCVCVFLKQTKHLLFRFFFIFFFFYKNMHTYTDYSGPREDTCAYTHTNSLLFFHSHAHTHTHTHTHTHIHTHKHVCISFLAPGLNPRSLEDCARVAVASPSPMSSIHSPLSQAIIIIVIITK